MATLRRMICINPAALRGLNAAITAIGLSLVLQGIHRPAAAQAVPQPKLPTVTLSAGFHNIVAEVAREPGQQSVGMMGRRSMAPHEGMLFVDAIAREKKCFWMSNTPLPLTIAFIADDGTILQLNDMQPLTTNEHCYEGKPIRFALEMNLGWFKQRGIKPGFKLRGPPFAN